MFDSLLGEKRFVVLIRTVKGFVWLVDRYSLLPYWPL